MKVVTMAIPMMMVMMVIMVIMVMMVMMVMVMMVMMVTPLNLKAPKPLKPPTGSLEAKR